MPLVLQQAGLPEMAQDISEAEQAALQQRALEVATQQSARQQMTRNPSLAALTKASLQQMPSAQPPLQAAEGALPVQPNILQVGPGLHGLCILATENGAA